jgi:hypothetical protein
MDTLIRSSTSSFDDFDNIWNVVDSPRAKRKVLGVSSMDEHHEFFDMRATNQLIAPQHRDEQMYSMSDIFSKRSEGAFADLEDAQNCRTSFASKTPPMVIQHSSCADEINYAEDLMIERYIQSRQAIGEDNDEHVADKREEYGEGDNNGTSSDDDNVSVGTDAEDDREKETFSVSYLDEEHCLQEEGGEDAAVDREICMANALIGPENLVAAVAHHRKSAFVPISTHQPSVFPSIGDDNGSSLDQHEEEEDWGNDGSSLRRSVFVPANLPVGLLPSMNKGGRRGHYSNGNSLHDGYGHFAMDEDSCDGDRDNYTTDEWSYSYGDDDRGSESTMRSSHISSGRNSFLLVDAQQQGPGGNFNPPGGNGNPQQQAVESPGRIGQSMSCNDVRKIAPLKVPSPVYATKARSARSTPESMRANRPVYSNGGGCGRRAELFDDDSTPLVGELEL